MPTNSGCGSLPDPAPSGTPTGIPSPPACRPYNSGTGNSSKLSDEAASSATASTIPGSGTTAAVSKKLGRTYIGIERDETYLALARQRLEQIPPYDPESLEVTASKRAAPRIPFGQVVERGLLDPGQVLFDANRRFFARVRADGSLVCDGASGSIHKIGAHVQGAPACNGWTFWHFDVEGRAVAIDVLRQKLRSEII